MFIDPEFRHVRVHLWSPSDGRGCSTAVDKFHEAGRADVIVRQKASSDWFDLTYTVLRADLSADAFERQVTSLVRLCGASFLAGKRERSREISALLEVGS